VIAIHILLRISAINMALCAAIFLPSRKKKWKYNPTCVEDEVSISDIYYDMKYSSCVKLHSDNHNLCKIVPSFVLLISDNCSRLGVLNYIYIC
jgi:hypothetical protein